MGLKHSLIGQFPWLLDRVNYVEQLAKLLPHFASKRNPWKIPITSRDLYDAIDAKEQRDYYNDRKRLCRSGGRNIWATEREARMKYLEPIVREIDGLLAVQDRVSILEVGCGNCINLIELTERYGDRIVLKGIDISSGRLNVARDYFGDRLVGIETWVESITDPTPDAQKAQYDLVFSMHCLEQIPYAAVQAVAGLWDRAISRVVMIEPVWEYARGAQRLKLVRDDYIRTLLPAVRYLGYPIQHEGPLGFESSQKNQSSLIILTKTDTRGE